MADGPTREEYTATMNRLYQQIDDGFSGVHSRLDKLNGRTQKTEVALAAETALVEALPCRQGQAACAATPRDEPASGIGWTRREKAIVGLGFSALVIALRLVEVLGERLWSLIKVGS